MGVLNEGTYVGDFLHWENVESRFSRDEITVGPTSGLAKGTVLGQITATKKYVQLAPAAADGSQIAKAVLLKDVAASGGDTKSLAIRRQAVMKGSGLIWPGSITAPQKATATDQLESALITIR